MCVCTCTQYFFQWGGASVQYHKCPKHRGHVEDDIAQERTRGHSKRFDQRHTACNYCSNKDTSSCGGRKNKQDQILWPFFIHLILHVWVSAYQIRLRRRDRLCVGRRKLPWHWICQERHYQEPEMSHPQDVCQSRKIVLTISLISLLSCNEKQFTKCTWKSENFWMKHSRCRWRIQPRCEWGADWWRWPTGWDRNCGQTVKK